MAAIETHHRQTESPQPMPQPGRQQTALQTDPHRRGRSLLDKLGNRLRRRADAVLTDNLATGIDDTHKSLFQ
ncbi:MAG: hypothetical protein V3R80_01900 [Candidatus Tectomicrobia bacterium]